jgi:hypothetical protein
VHLDYASDRADSLLWRAGIGLIGNSVTRDSDCSASIE